MIQLFHKGTSHVINDVTCEMQTVNEFGFEHYLEEEWYLTPEECYEEKKVKIESIEEKVTVKRIPVVPTKKEAVKVNKKA
jgi:hypothetical protein